MATLQKLGASPDSDLPTAAAPELSSAAETLLHLPVEESAIFSSAETVRKALSNETSPQVGLVVRMGLAPVLVSLLDYTSERVRVEAAWAITNIAASTEGYCKALRDLGAATKLVATLSNTSSLLKEQVCESRMLNRIVHVGDSESGGR